MSNKALQSGGDFLRRYNAEHGKIGREKVNENAGNFSTTASGDLKPIRYLTKHARQRMEERGVSLAHAIKGTTKSGAIIAPNGAVVTVIPEAWSSSKNRNQKMDDTTKQKQNTTHVAQIPTEDVLPEGHTVVEKKSSYMGYLLGKKHVNIAKLTQTHRGIKYVVAEDSLWIWGPSNKVDGLLHDIDLQEEEIIEKLGPPVPDKEALPDGHSCRRVVVPLKVVSHVVGQNGRNIKNLREEHKSSSVSVNMNSKTREMHVWGESTAVDKVCETVAAAIDEAKHIKVREKPQEIEMRKQAKKTRDEKMKKSEDDTKKLNVEKVKTKRGKALPSNSKENKRKQSHASKHAAKEAGRSTKRKRKNA